MVGSGGDLIPPGSFLPVAEKYGLIGEIDRWVIRQAVGLAASGHRVEANLSAESIGNLDLLPLIERELRNAHADPSKIVFEITETALMENPEAGEAFARGLSEVGCPLALDDFGTGFGNFTYLKNLPITYLKIDIEFVRDLTTNQANRHLVKAIVGLAQDFGCQTIAEGVEDAETLALLKRVRRRLCARVPPRTPSADRGFPWMLIRRRSRIRPRAIVSRRPPTATRRAAIRTRRRLIVISRRAIRIKRARTQIRTRPTRTLRAALIAPRTNARQRHVRMPPATARRSPPAGTGWAGKEPTRRASATTPRHCETCERRFAMRRRFGAIRRPTLARIGRRSCCAAHVIASGPPPIASGPPKTANGQRQIERSRRGSATRRCVFAGNRPSSWRRRRPIS